MIGVATVEGSALRLGGLIFTTCLIPTRVGRTSRCILDRSFRLSYLDTSRGEFKFADLC